MKKLGVFFLMLFCLFLSGCAGGNNKPEPTELSESSESERESESIPLITEPTETESEEADPEGFKNSVWEPYAVPLDLTILTDEGTMQFDTVYHDTFYVVITYHFIPKKQNWKPRSDVDADTAKMLRGLAEFQFKRSEKFIAPQNEQTYIRVVVEPKVRADGSVGVFVKITVANTFAPIMKNDVVLCSSGVPVEGQLLPAQTYRISLDFEFDYREISLDNAKINPEIGVNGATLSPYSFVIYGRFLRGKFEDTKEISTEINKVAKTFQVRLKNDDELFDPGWMREGTYCLEPEWCIYRVDTFFGKPLDVKNVEGILLENGVLLLPKEPEEEEE